MLHEATFLPNVEINREGRRPATVAMIGSASYCCALLGRFAPTPARNAASRSLLDRFRQMNDKLVTTIMLRTYIAMRPKNSRNDFTSIPSPLSLQTV